MGEDNFASDQEVACSVKGLERYSYDMICLEDYERGPEGAGESSDLDSYIRYIKRG